ncbi:Mobile element protein [hydrothermal vent metagenome]|uniref:Mobile element protein n=1 Tax=hydrothermal vent metagenome TaxID=652676 RepID=A0A1W1CML9_9ZZZZ
MGYDFLIRYTGQQFLKETLPLVDSSENDMEIEVSLTKGFARQNNLAIKELLAEGVAEKIKLRIVKIELSNGKMEYLITTLLSKREHKLEDFKYLYNLRWNEEVYFDYQKNVIEVERFSGKTVESIKQDYYSRILVGNLHALIVEDAQAEIDVELSNNKKLKYSKYKINKSISFGLLRGSLEKLLTTHNWLKKYNDLVKKTKMYKVPIRENRTYERIKNGNLKYSNNVRRVI